MNRAPSRKHPLAPEASADAAASALKQRRAWAIGMVVAVATGTARADIADRNQTGDRGHEGCEGCGQPLFRHACGWHIAVCGVATIGRDRLMKAYVLSTERRPPPLASKWRRFVDRYLPSVVIYLMVATLVAVVLYPHVVVTVPSGQVGVLWKRFGGGTMLDPRRLKDESLHLIWPWDELFLFDLRLQSITETYSAISSDGVSLSATMNVRFRLSRDAIPVLHQAVGPNYVQLLGLPGFGSLTREVIAQYTAEQVYSTARQDIQEKIRSLVENRLSGKMMEREGDEQYRVSMKDTFILYDTLVYGIELPELVVNAINRKTEQYYIAEEYRFRVERERRESERKKIEAEGIHAFQQLVSQGISPSYGLARHRGNASVGAVHQC
jgi:regulator of protease activity HflC (stomatin/prohibitin superfamily)